VTTSLIGPEQVELFATSELAAQLYTDGALDGPGFRRYLDKVRSVSGLPVPGHILWPDDSFLDQQHRRFLNAFFSGEDDEGSFEGGVRASDEED